MRLTKLALKDFLQFYKDNIGKSQDDFIIEDFLKAYKEYLDDSEYYEQLESEKRKAFYG